MLLLQPLIGLLLISLAHGDFFCPISFNPPDVVVEYGASFSVNCSSSFTDQFGLSWEGFEDAMENTEEILKRVDKMTDWEMNLTCYMYSNETHCKQDLPVTIYKTPDSVSISTVDHSGPMMEGQQYELQCDVHNVAPVQDLTVKWYKEQTLLDQTIFTDTSKTPVNETATLLIRPDRADDGAQYRCEAELNLGAEGPQTPTETLEPLSVEIYYKPQHSSSTETIIKDDKVMLDCTVKANPAPRYTWRSDHLEEGIRSSVLSSSTLSPGNYTCTATNALGNASKVFIVESTDSQCPVQIIPWRVVVRYGDDVSADCKTSVLHQGMGWEASEGAVPMTKNQNLITWRVSELTEWDIKPFCYINYKIGDQNQCQVELPVTVYKTPDSVSISTVDHSGPMIEGKQYELQCDVHDVAPVEYLTVKWYKGQTLLSQTTFTDTSETPVNETATLLIRPDRDDDGAQYRCEAELDLGAEGPQTPTETLEPLSVEIYYKPQHSSSTETIIKDDKVMLDCTVKANPAPRYTWRSDHLKEGIRSSVLSSSTLSPGNYTCTATNDLGSDSKVFIVESTDSQCPVQIIPRRAVVRYGDDVSADCKTSVLHQGMGWEASEGAVPMTKDQNLITWRVSELTDWDIKPFCYINYKTGDQNQCLVELPVTVYKTPDSVSISTVDHSGPMMEGKQYELQCDVHDVAPVQDLTVKWYKGQTLLDQTIFTDTSETPVNETATLLIRPDRDDDGAQYRCEAELDLGEEGPQPHPTNSSKPLSITVHFAPQIRFCSDWSPLTNTSLDSYPLNLYSVVGNPRPDISWRHKSSSVSSSMPLTKYDSGRYEIIARNDLDDFSCFMNITVEYPPELNCNESYEVNEKIPFHLPCIADGLPKPEFSLYKNGKMIPTDFQPNWNDSGRYQLIARNQCGTINSSFTINILHAPVFYDSQEKFVVGEGYDITLECNFTGNPEPEVWWSFKNKNISTGRRYNIVRAKSTHAGDYTCSATNKFGRRDKTFTVEIKDHFPIYILIVLVVLVLLVLIILLVVLMWRRRKSRGRYEIQSVKEHEMQPLSNGGPK